MKRIKVLLVLLLVLITAGCSVEYELTINKDNSVSEKVVAIDNTERLLVNTNLNEKDAVNYLYQMFDRDGLSTKISYVSKDGNTVATVTGNHNTLQDYVDNFTSDLFSNAELVEDGDKVTLVFNQVARLGKDNSRSLIYDNITVRIKVPFKVLDHNADEARYGVYTWNIKENDNLRTLSITYDKGNMRDEQKITIGNFSFSIKYQYIAFTILGLIVAAIIIIVIINNRKNNKM
ncbi:MAG: hypothetical protein IKF36_05720 [Bacilli bacterium]|nr:hypothetical protein [Bacilli bacterium]